MKGSETVNSNGTSTVGYMPPEAGPFRCANCAHYVDKANGSGCDDKEVAEDLGRARNGLAPVSPDGCCNEFKPKNHEARGGRLRIGLRLIQEAKK